VSRGSGPAGGAGAVLKGAVGSRLGGLGRRAAGAGDLELCMRGTAVRGYSMLNVNNMRRGDQEVLYEGDNSVISCDM